MAELVSVERVETGEVGFCSRCGDTVRVVVPPADRQSVRLLQAERRLQALRGVPPAPTAALRLARANQAQLKAGIQAGALITERILLGKCTRSDLFLVRQALRDGAAAIALAEAALSEILHEPVDLLREATEDRESWVAEGQHGR
ncbi:MAG: hypothetical protein KF821_09115 [Anaerolineales bacterium]|nr:hypothetical protein [Anaerolineales bacterium]